MLVTLTNADIGRLTDDQLRTLSRANNALAARLQSDAARYQRQRVRIERELKRRQRAWRSREA